MSEAMQRRTGKSAAVASALASILLSAPALASADATSPPLSTTLVAELFAFLAFVLLAVVAHWAARRHRVRS